MDIQNNSLEIIDSSPFTVKEIVQKILIWQHQETIYGFGDMQYFLYLKKLHSFIEISEEKYFLNETGKAIINQ